MEEDKRESPWAAGARQAQEAEPEGAAEQARRKFSELRRNAQQLLGEVLAGKRQFVVQSLRGGGTQVGVLNLDVPLNKQPGLEELFLADPKHITIMEWADKGGNAVLNQHVIPAEHFDKSIAEIFSQNLHQSQAKESGGFRARLPQMSAMDKGWAAANAALSVLFLHEAVRNFRHVREQDPLSGQQHTNWSNLTWGTVNAGLAALSAVQTAGILKGGRLR